MSKFEIIGIFVVSLIFIFLSYAIYVGPASGESIAYFFSGLCLGVGISSLGTSFIILKNR